MTPATPSRGPRAVLPLVLAALAAVVGAGLAARRRFRRRIDRAVDGLLADTAPPAAGAVVTAAGLEGLPDPVRRYFEHVLEEGQPHVRMARLRQRGEFRLGGPDAPWRPLTATQTYSVSPPGFVWEATIDVAPLLPVRVLDSYRDGAGVLRARLLSVLPVASAGPGPGMDEGELVRYLAEAVWFPTALLPAAGVEWTPVDENSARATLEHRGLTVSAVFHFEEGEVRRVTAERYRQEADDYAPWTGHFEAYEERDGLRVPTSAAVEWNLPGGDLRYWRAEVTAIEHHTDSVAGD